MILSLDAPAKINLGLEVLRRREDGFHDINTIFAAVDLCDRVELRTRDDGLLTLAIDGNDDLAAGDDNLCIRAARALRLFVGQSGLGLDIGLTKRIPVGAGLGGGSSDAATVLRGALRLWNLDVPIEELSRIALSLGSDVPFFLHDGPARATSRGELLLPIDLRLPGSVLLVNPGIHISTPWAYRAIGRTGERPSTDLADSLRRGLVDHEVLRREVVNDFETPVFTAYPLLRELKERLYDSGAFFALMSGSGSTMFGLYPDRSAALDAARRFDPLWNVVAGWSVVA